MTTAADFYVDSECDEINELQRDGATAIIDLAAIYKEYGTCNDLDLKAKVIGRMSDIQVRDFALGSHNESTIDVYWAMWADLMEIAPRDFIAPVATLHAALSYEKGELAMAQESLDRAFADDSTYSLAALLRRVFAAGWPPAAFASMRMELHPKVCAGIFGYS